MARQSLARFEGALERAERLVYILAIGKAAAQQHARRRGYDLLYLSGITLSILDAAQREALTALAEIDDSVRGAPSEANHFIGTPEGWEHPMTPWGEPDLRGIWPLNHLIGTPFCIAVDHQTLEDDTVTIRYRDSMQQERIPMDKVKDLVLEKIKQF